MNPAPFLGATTPKGLGQVPYLVYGESSECAHGLTLTVAISRPF